MILLKMIYDNWGLTDFSLIPSVIENESNGNIKGHSKRTFDQGELKSKQKNEQG